MASNEADNFADLKKKKKKIAIWHCVERKNGISERRTFQEKLFQRSVGDGVMRSYVRPFSFFFYQQQLHSYTLSISSSQPLNSLTPNSAPSSFIRNESLICSIEFDVDKEAADKPVPVSNVSLKPLSMQF